jgi:hypothetical protein
MCQRRFRPFVVPTFLLFTFLLTSRNSCAQLLYHDYEAEVHNLPLLESRTKDAADVLQTGLATIFHDKEVCCGKDSALGDSVDRADPTSLKDVAARLNGRQKLSDGRAVMVTAEFVPTDKGRMLIERMMHEHAPLMQWKSQLYVVHDVVYRWSSSSTPDSGGLMMTVIRKFLLWDVRFSDSRRDVVFDLERDDLSQVQGFLYAESKME